VSSTADSSYDDSFRETADNDYGTTQTRAVGTELAEEPPAEPMSREEYGDYMRQGPAADGGDTNGEDGTEYTGEPGDGYDSFWTDPAEQAQGMAREEYADFMRHGLAAGADEYGADDDYDPEGFDQARDTRHEPRWRDPAEQAQGMTPSEYAGYMRQGPAAGEDDPGDADPGNYGDVSGEPGTGDPESGDDASSMQRAANGEAALSLDPPVPDGRRANQAGDDHEVIWPQGAEAAMLTDPDPIGSSHRPGDHELVDSAERSADQQSGDNAISEDQVAPSAHHEGRPGHQPEKITFDSKELEVTHNAADGIWVEGLAGEPPTRIGDVLSSPDQGDRRRIENLREEFNKDAEDIIDMGGKWTDLLRDAFGAPPPTHSMTHNRSPEMPVSGPEHGVNAGHTVEAALTLTIVGVAAAHKLHEWWQGARERRHERKEADHAGN
jgi:hypothetical protein